MFVSASPDDAGTVIVPVETPGRLRIAGLPPGFGPMCTCSTSTAGGWWPASASSGWAGRPMPWTSGVAAAATVGLVRWGRLYAGDPLDDLDRRRP